VLLLQPSTSHVSCLRTFLFQQEVNKQQIEEKTQQEETVVTDRKVT
jgi:hypothetical protein